MERAPLGTFSFNLGSWVVEPTYLQAGLIVILLFLLVFSLARLRHMYVNWSFKGAVSWLFMGFVLAIIVEGFMILGGRTLFTEIMGWKDAPKPLQVALDSGRSRLVEVLGVTDEVPTSLASEKSKPDQLVEIYQSLSPMESKRIRSLICEP